MPPRDLRAYLFDVAEACRLIGSRNQLAHGYASIADDVVWDVVETNLPALRERVSALLLELDDRRQ